MKNIYVQIVEPFEDCGELYEFSNPEKAIKKWFELGEKYPSCVGMDIMALCKEHKCHYRPEYLIDGIQRGLSNSRLISWEYDSVFPFTFG